MDFWNLFVAFFRIGIFGYGGGPSMIPLVHAEAVEKYKWMNDEEFSDILALGNALPGPIATKMAGYIGYKVKGTLGSIIAISAMVLPVLIGMVVLLNFVYTLKDSGIVQGMIQAIRPVIGVMIAVLAYDFYKKAWKGWSRKSKTVFWSLVSLVSIGFLGLNPGLIIAIALTYAFVESTLTAKKKTKEKISGEGSSKTG